MCVCVYGLSVKRTCVPVEVVYVLWLLALSMEGTVSTVLIVCVGVVVGGGCGLHLSAFSILFILCS